MPVGVSKEELSFADCLARCSVKACSKCWPQVLLTERQTPGRKPSLGSCDKKWGECIGQAASSVILRGTPPAGDLWVQRPWNPGNSRRTGVGKDRRPQSVFLPLHPSRNLTAEWSESGRELGTLLCRPTQLTYHLRHCMPYWNSVFRSLLYF